MLRASARTMEWCARILMALGCIAIAMMMLHTMLEVLMRYFMNASIPGTEEIISGYYMVSAVFLPLGAVQLERGHLFIELFTLKVSERGKAWMDGCVYLVCGAALAVFTYAGVNKAMEMTRKGEIWIGMIDVLIWPARWLLPAGLLVMTLIMAIQAVHEFHFAATGEDARTRNHPETIENP